MRASARRLGLIVGWMLTPVAAWALSFLGGWLGASAGSGSSSDYGGLICLGTGAIAGGIAGGVGWALVMRTAARMGRKEPAEHPADH